MSAERPRPSEIDIGLMQAAPFVGGFGRFEREVAAALYVEACAHDGDVWEPITPKRACESLRRLAAFERVPTWISFLAAFGYVPDFRGLVDGGHMTLDEETKLMMPTAAFFERVKQFRNPAKRAEVSS